MIANGMVEEEFNPSHSTAYLYEGSFVLYFCPRIWKLTEWPLPSDAMDCQIIGTAIDPNDER
jgi:hypothetical protein